MLTNKMLFAIQGQLISASRTLVTSSHELGANNFYISSSKQVEEVGKELIDLLQNYFMVTIVPFDKAVPMKQVSTVMHEKGFFPYTPHPTPYTLFQGRGNRKLLTEKIFNFSCESKAHLKKDVF